DRSHQQNKERARTPTTPTANWEARHRKKKKSKTLKPPRKLLSSGEEQKVKPSEADSPMQHLLPGRSSPPSSPNRSGRGANKDDDVGSMLGSVPSPGVGH
ncbi:unnamed protein product, partial [Musa hybrid cultivar]